jgi:hypothetical protein
MTTWHDFKIGEGDNLCSAITIYQSPDGLHVSQNNQAYWITGSVLGIGCTIMKSTPEGQEITRLLAQRNTNDAIKAYIASLVFRCCPPDKLSQRLASALDRAFQDGREQKAAEIRAALGLE